MATPNVVPNPTVVTMFAPDGSMGDVPQQNVQAAIKGGGKIAVKMTAPDGSTGFVPHDQVLSAQKAGGQVLPDQTASGQPKEEEGFWHSLATAVGIPTSASEAKSMVTGMLHRQMDNAFSPGIGALMPSPQEIHDSVASEAPKVADEAHATVNAFKQGDYGQAAAHAAGTAGYAAATATAPLGGTSLAKAGEQFGEGNVRGGLGTTIGLIAPIAAGEAVRAKGPGIMRGAQAFARDAVNDGVATAAGRTVRRMTKPPATKLPSMFNGDVEPVLSGGMDIRQAQPGIMANAQAAPSTYGVGPGVIEPEYVGEPDATDPNVLAGNQGVIVRPPKQLPAPRPLFSNPQLPPAEPEPIPLGASPLVPTEPQGVLPAARRVFYDPETGQARTQFLTSIDQNAAANKPASALFANSDADTQLLNDPRGALSRYVQENPLGGLADPLDTHSNTSVGAPRPIDLWMEQHGDFLGTGDAATPLPPQASSGLPAWAQEVANWERSDPQHLFNLKDEHDFLSAIQQEQIQKWIAQHNTAPEPLGNRPPVATRPPDTQNDLSSILQASIDQVNAKKNGTGPGLTNNGAPPPEATGPGLMRNAQPERRINPRDPSNPYSVRISTLRREMSNVTDPAERAEYQAAIDRETALMNGQQAAPNTFDPKRFPEPDPNAPHYDASRAYPPKAELQRVMADMFPGKKWAELPPEQRDAAAARAWQLKDQALEGGTGLNASKPVPAADLKPGDTGFVSTSDLSRDPQRFQYKISNIGEGGVSNSLKGQPFNDKLAGVVAVWTDPADGKTYVVNGHHRLDLALETKQPAMRVMKLDAANPQEARMQGALINIAEGRGTAYDAARFFQDSGLGPNDLKKEGVSLSESKVSDGLALSKLDPSILDRVGRGEIPESRGILIGQQTDDPAKQEAILKFVDQQEAKGRKVNNDTLSEIARFVKLSGNRTIEQGGLFSGNQIRSLALEKAEISAGIKQQLAKEKRVFGAVSDQGKAEILGRVKDQSIQPGENKQISQNAAQMLELYDRLSGTAGPVNDILESVAKEQANGYLKPAEARSKAYDLIREELRKALPGGQDSGGTGSTTRPGFPAPPK